MKKYLIKAIRVYLFDGLFRVFLNAKKIKKKNYFFLKGFLKKKNF